MQLCYQRRALGQIGRVWSNIRVFANCREGSLSREGDQVLRYSENAPLPLMPPPPVREKIGSLGAKAGLWALLATLSNLSWAGGGGGEGMQSGARGGKLDLSPGAGQIDVSLE